MCAVRASGMFVCQGPCYQMLAFPDEASLFVQGTCQQVTLRVLCNLRTPMAGSPGRRNSLLPVQPSKMPSGHHQAMLLLQSPSGRSTSSSSPSQRGVGIVETCCATFLLKWPHLLAVSTRLI